MTSLRLQRLFQFLASDPKDSFVLFAIAKEYEKLENREKALEFYLRLLTTNPDYVGTYYHLAKLYEQEEKRELALETYQKGIETARKMGDHHALSELSGAKMNLEIE